MDDPELHKQLLKGVLQNSSLENFTKFRGKHYLQNTSLE